MLGLTPLAIAAKKLGGRVVAAVVSFSGGNAARLSTDPTDAYAGFRFLRSGSVQRVQAATLSWGSFEDWIAPKNATVGDDYELRLTLNSGTFPAGGGLSAGTWYSLDQTRSFYHSRTSPGTLAYNITAEVRDVATETIQDSATYTATATVDVGGTFPTSL